MEKINPNKLLINVEKGSTGRVDTLIFSDGSRIYLPIERIDVYGPLHINDQVTLNPRDGEELSSFEENGLQFIGGVGSIRKVRA